ncbi:CCR4-NOT transcription complex subunit 3 [Nilaparvata lugens]|uniref:CCR4-NOT transcription complex subunit 3 n=1 Tax=Nilaparvata lugens TaxID=108931 RepID=UPI00193D2A5B|nr:CCR4-NOT transcription complex subunit 3 [Nilaparvata lugens]
MAATRKLQGEIERCLKKVTEGVETFEDIWQKVHNATNSNQKEKYEADLKKEIKKLQRLRDQIKSWIASGEIKDKSTLLDYRKLIETQMERFKVVERETKTKAYSKEGLGAAQKMDPAQKEREEVSTWLVNSIDSLNQQLDQFECETESLLAGKKKRLDKDKQDRMDELKSKLERHRYHIRKLETLLRMLDNMSVEVQQIKGIKENVEYYIDSSHEQQGLEESEYIYDDIIGLDEIELSGVGLPSSATTDDSNGGSPTSMTSSPAASPPLGGSAASVTGAGGLNHNHSGSGSESNAASTTINNVSNNGGGSVEEKREKKKEVVGSTQEQIQNKSVVKPTAVRATSALLNSTTGAPNNSTNSQQQLKNNNMAAGATSPNNLLVANHNNNNKLQHQTPNNSSPSSGGGGHNNSNNNHSQQNHTSSSAASASATAAAVAASNFAAVAAAAVTGIPQTQLSNKISSHLTENGTELHNNIGSRSSSSPPSSVSSAESPATQSQPLVASRPSPPSRATATVTPPPPSQQQQQQSAAALLAARCAAAAAAVEQAAALTSLKCIAQQVIDKAGLMPNDASATAANPTEQAARGLFDSSSSQSGGPKGGSKGGTDTSRNLASLTSEAHIPPLLGVAPLGPVPLQKEHQCQFQMMEAAYYHMPHPADSERIRQYLPRNPCPTPPYYNQVPLAHSDTLEFFQRLSTETLFFIFYYMEGSKAQYMAAKALKKQSWRFHTKYMMWFQRHEEPKLINEEYEQGTYIYFDYEKWGQRKKEGFTFEYKYLEDRDLN